MSALSKALKSSRAIACSARDDTSQTKASGMDSAFSLLPTDGFGQWQNNAKHREKYSLFRGWVYSAINVIASEAAGQPVRVGRLKRGASKQNNLSIVKSKMPTDAGMKSVNRELELLDDHPVLSALAKPNPLQGRWQFVYSFIANLNLTGWAYIIRNEDEEGRPEFYSLPTTWVKPNHTKGPFSEFLIANPQKPSVTPIKLSREQVGFGHLPNPSDPLSALAPSDAQIMSIRINDHIETSRERLFENGIFPSVILTMGSKPHPDVPAGVRPRLTGAQRRQIHTAIHKVWGGVAKYGTPAIVDGLIEKIDRLSMSANEMGWEKSEQSIKTSILSCFAVHPFLLGEDLNIGGYSQVTSIIQRFHKRVNTQLDMLSGVMSNLVGGQDDELLVWWEILEAVDPMIRTAMIKFLRMNNDISQNEARAEAGFAPDVDRNESLLSMKMAGEVNKLLEKLGKGVIDRDQAVAFLAAIGLPDEQAEAIAGPVGGGGGVIEGEVVDAVGSLRRPIGDEVKRVAGLIVDATRSHD